MAIKLLTFALNVQSDVVGARQRARQLAQLLGFDLHLVKPVDPGKLTAAIEDA